MAQATEIIIRAKDETRQAISQVQSSLKGLEQSAIGLGPVFAGLTAALSVATFKEAITGAISFAARLDDMAESTGATVENLSALAGVAKIGGHDLGLVESSLIKLSKALHSTDEDSKGAGKALAQIGLDIKDLASKDSAEAMLDVAKALDQFESGSGKTAVAVALLGKNGAALLPFLTDLAEKSELVGKLTTEQAAMAEAYEKNIVKLTSSFGVASKTVAMELLPFLTKLTDEMVAAKDESGSFASAIGEGVRTALETVAVLGVNVAYVFKSVGTEIGGLAAQLAAFATGDFKGAFAIGDMMKEDAAKARAEVDALSARILDRTAVVVAATKTQKKSLKDVDLSSDPKTSAKKSDYQQIIEALNQKISVQTADLMSTEKLNEAQKDYAKYQADLASGATKLTAEQQKVVEAYYATYMARAKENELDKSTKKAGLMIDEYQRSNALIVERIDRESQLAMMTDRQRLIAEALYKVEEDGAKIRERILRDIPEETAQKIALAKAEDELATQRERVAQSTADSYDAQKSFEFGWTKAFQAYSESAHNAATQAQDVFNRASQSMEDALVSFATTGKISFGSLANSIIADIVRMQARAATSGLMGMLTQAFSSSSSSGGNTTPGFSSSDLGSGIRINALGGVYSSPSLSSFSGGVYSTPQFFQFAKGAGVFAEAGPEGIFPLKRGRDGKLGVSAEGSGSVTVIVNNNTSAQATTQERSDGRGNRVIEVLIEQVKASIAGDISTGNGAVPNAMQISFGLSRRAGAY